MATRSMSPSNLVIVGALSLLVGTACEKPLIGPAPRLEANPAEITFASAGESGGETVLFLKNAGSADLVITGLAWSGTSGVEAKWVGRAAPSGDDPLVLEPGIPYNLPISYRVVAEQDPTGTFTVYSNDPGPIKADDLHRRIGELDVPALSLPNNPAVQIFTADRNGETIGDARLIAGDRIDFGEVPANQSRYARVTIKNDGVRPLVIQSVSVVASEPATAFSISGTAPAANSRVVPSRSAATGGALNEITFDVKYLSPSTARASGKLVIVSNDPVRPTHTIILVGGAITCNLVATPSPLDFGAVVRGQNAERTVTLENQGAANCTIDSIGMQPGQSADLTIVPNSTFINGAAQPASFNLAPAGRATFKVRYDSRDDTADVGHVIVKHREPQRDLDIRVVGTPINNAPPVCVCPASPIDTAPLQTIQLDGSRSNDPEGRTPLTCQWTSLSRPNGSTEPIGNANTARASFFVDLAGDYKFQLLCKDNYNAECAPCTVDVHAVPTDDLHIQLVWDTPTVDVDLHLLRAGATTTWFGADDCYFGNRTPQWFTPSSADNPRLDIDDTDGYGPENINVQRPAASPANQPYKIGIHYYSDDGIGATRATVRVYCFGTLAAEKGPVFLQKTNKWWDFGSIAWPGCQLTVNDPPPITDRSPSNPLFP